MQIAQNSEYTASVRSANKPLSDNLLVEKRRQKGIKPHSGHL